MIGELIWARVYAERIEIFYGNQKVDSLPRLYGRQQRRINYRHISEWLARKPGAFENYRYREELFPSSVFRTAYDVLKQQHAPSAARGYVRILHLATKEGEGSVECALRHLLKVEQALSFEVVEHLVLSSQAPQPATAVEVGPADLSVYDGLLAQTAGEVAHV